MVSVVIPTFNRAESVGRAIRSVMEQEASPAEIVVVDDGSTDATRDVLEQFGSRIVSVAIAHSGLPSVARNAGIQASSSELVAFLDSDDEWLPYKLGAQLRTLEQDDSVGMVCSNCFVRSSADDRHEQTYFAQTQRGRTLGFADLLRSNTVVNSTAIVSRSALDQAGPFDEDPLLRGVEDYDLWLRVSQVAGIRYLPEALAVYRDRADSIRSAGPRSQYWLALLRILEKIAEMSPETYLSYRRIIDQRRSACLGALASVYAREGRGNGMLKASLDRIRVAPASPVPYLSLLKNGLLLLRSWIGT